MKQLNYASLQGLAKNTTSNKSINAEDSASVLLSLLDYNSNLEEFLRKANCYDAANTIISENNWILRRRNTTTKEQISEGCVFRTDFGNAYIGECSYVHYSLCVRLYNDKALVVPMTSNENQINKAFHPRENESGEYKLRRGLRSEGFIDDCAMFMNDVKFISFGRIIKALPAIDNTALISIQEQLYSIIFPTFSKQLKRYKTNEAYLQQYIEDLEYENQKLHIELGVLKSQKNEG